MIEVTKYKAINKNSLVAIIDIKIPKWGNFILREVSLFKKGAQRWISFPSRAYESDGAKKYYHYALFEEKATMEKFQEKALEALDEYLAKNPQEAEPSAFTPDPNLPF